MIYKNFYIYQQGRPAYFDIRIRNSLQSSYISMSAGAAALAGQSEKDDRHREAVERTGSISC